MNAFPNFSIPFKSLKSGIHEYDYQLSNKFFDEFEGSLIKKGKFQVDLLFDKQIDMFVLVFDIDGWAETNCDRCLENFQLPIKAKHQLILKFAEEQSEDPLVEHISNADQQINVAKYIYEFISLSIPLRKVHEDADENCNAEMLKHLDGIEEEEEVENDNPLWDALKNFKEN